MTPNLLIWHVIELNEFLQWFSRSSVPFENIQMDGAKSIDG